VYNDDLKTDPVVLREKQYENFVYKMVNAWGDGFRANEFYDTERPSVFDNDFIPVQKGSYIKQYNFFGDVLEETIYTSPERTDAEIRKFLPTSIPLQKPSMVMQPDNIQKILSGEKTSTLRTESFPSGVYNFGGKDFQVTNRGLLNVQEAGGAEAISKSEAFAETGPKYPSTKDFLEGKRKLYVYDISPVVPLQEEEEVPSSREYTPENITSLKPNEVFVFGSNTEGRHGAGAAKIAKDKFGAIDGQKEGLQGQSYAIITKDLSKGKKSIPLFGKNSIAEGVEKFVEFANANMDKKFYVTKIGTSLAGYNEEQIKQVFQSINEFWTSEGIENYIPNNVILSKELEVRKDLSITDKDWTSETNESQDPFEC
jgi:hypothetical protein